VGRRGQGQAGRLALVPRRRGGALQGGHKRRPHAGGRQPGLQALPAPLRRRARQAVGDRQWSGGRPLALLDEIERLRGQHIDINPDLLVVADNATLSLPLHRDLDVAREAQATAKIGTTGRGIGPAYEDKVGRRAIRVADLADREAMEAKIDRLLAHHGPLRRGLGLPEARRRRDPGLAGGGGAENPPLCAPGLEAARRGGQGRPAGAVRRRARRAARRRPRHLSLRHLLQHRRRPGRRGIGSGSEGAGLRAPASSSLHHPRLAKARSPPSCSTRSAGIWARSARGGHRHRRSRRLRLVRRRAGPPVGGDQRHRRHRADQARRARWPGALEDLRRL